MGKIKETMLDVWKHEKILVICLLVGAFLFLRHSSNKQVNKPDFTGANLTGAHIDFSNKTTKRFTPFIEGFGGISSNGEKRAEAGARLGVRVEF